MRTSVFLILRIAGRTVATRLLLGFALPCFAAGPPVITGFHPAAAPTGGNVTVSGRNFDPTPSNNIVYFGAVRAAVTAASTNSLTTAVPPGATHAPITVTANGLSAWAGTPFLPTFAEIGRAHV